jgi:hypothetical protein
MVIFRIAEDVLAERGYLNKLRPVQTDFEGVMPELKDACRRAYRRTGPISKYPTGYIQVSASDLQA